MIIKLYLNNQKIKCKEKMRENRRKNLFLSNRPYHIARCFCEVEKKTTIWEESFF